MPMSQEERRFFEEQVVEKYRWFNDGSRAWSFFYNGSLIVSAILSGSAVLVAKLSIFKEYCLTDEHIKDIVALLAAAATLLSVLTAGGGLGRKWQANRISRGRIDQFKVALSDPNADPVKLRADLSEIIRKHDEAIIGTPVK